MIDKIRQLRAILPVPITEAKQLLEANDGDVEKSVYLFKAKSIKQIQELTGCDADMAAAYYENEKFDFNRTVSSINEDIYDRNYKPIHGLTRDALLYTRQWIRLIEAEEFGVSLEYKFMDQVIETMALIPELKELSVIVDKAVKARREIFEGYSDADPLEEFVRRHRLLDDDKDFQQANGIVSLKVPIIDKELNRHIRNLPAEGNS